MLTNREIQRLFNLFAELLLLHEKEEKLSRSLSSASYRLRKMNEDVLSLPRKQWSTHFSPPIIKLLSELYEKNTITDLDELIQLTPPGLFDMMRIKGLGGKKLAVLWKVAKIESVDSLLEAAKTNKLTGIPGFGAKTVENIIEAIENFHASRDRFHFADVADSADTLITALQKIFKTKLVSTCGEVRRCATTVADIEIIIAVDPKKFNGAAIKKILITERTENHITYAHTLDELPVIIQHVNETEFYLELFKRTGSEAHVNRIIENIASGKFSSEEAIYKKAKLPFIAPEMREDNLEWDFKYTPDDLITTEDITGVVHNHTDWSDGVDTLENFVMACKKKGYQYCVISDHSKNAHYAGGLKEEKLLRQIETIKQLNEKLSPFKIFSSVECDILISGELDYDNTLLKKLDLVIVSIHQLLKMDEAKATKRLIKAIENPYTTILGHMTGRQLLIRPGYPVNFKKVIDACAANNVVIEINANPYRLDMDWSHVPYAMKKKVMISINPDAHSIREIDNIRWGVAAARKGGLIKDMTWNAMSLPKIEAWLRARRKKLK